MVLDYVYAMPTHFENGEKCDGSKFELAFTRYRRNLKTVGNLMVEDSLQGFDAKEMDIHPKNLSISFQNRRMFFSSFSSVHTMPFPKSAG